MKNKTDIFVNKLYKNMVLETKAKENAKSTEKYDDNKHLKGNQDELPDNLQKGIIKKANPDDPDLDEGRKKKKRTKKTKKRTRKKASDNPGYRAGRNKKQLKKLNRDTDYAHKNSGKISDKKYKRMEKTRIAELPKGKKTPQNPYTGRIAVGESVDREKLRELLREAIIEIIDEKRKKRKKSKKKKSKTKKKTLSKKTMATLRKKAKASGYTAGSLASEYRKGLGAYYTSGSRKGMGSHQWAMARVNSAIGKGNPSWANLKRSKAKKK